MEHSSATTPVVLKVSRPADVLAAIPYLLGFHPKDSIVVLVFREPDKRVKLSLRVDLPSGDPSAAGRLADRLGALAADRDAGHVILVGYGPSARVTPVIEALRGALVRSEVRVSEALRAQHGRYWSYLCHDPACCAPSGEPYDVASNAVAATATVAGCVALPDRDALRDSVAPLRGTAAAAARRATERARSELAGLSGARRAEAGKAAVLAAIVRARGGGPLPIVETALLAEHLTDLRVRDEAWVRIVPPDLAVHRELWTQVVRRCAPDVVTAPAALLAFTAWQQGDGGLANVALDRALAADPDYSMAKLLAEALDAAVPPSAWRPVTPAELEARGPAGEPAASGGAGFDDTSLPRAG